MADVYMLYDWPITGTFHTTEKVLEFAKLGTYCEYDLFGIEVSHYQFEDTDMPSDAQRIQYIKELIEDGREDKIVIAHDIHTKHRLVGWSYMTSHFDYAHNTESWRYTIR